MQLLEEIVSADGKPPDQYPGGGETKVTGRRCTGGDEIVTPFPRHNGVARALARPHAPGMEVGCYAERRRVAGGASSRFRLQLVPSGEGIPAAAAILLSRATRSRIAN